MVAVDRRGSDTEKTDEIQIAKTWVLSVTMVNKSPATVSDMPGGSTEHHLAVTFLKQTVHTSVHTHQLMSRMQILKKKCHLSLP